MADEKTKDEQAVADKPDEQATPATEDGSAQENIEQSNTDQDDLDELLKDWDQRPAAEQPSSQESAPAEKPDINVVARLEKKLNEWEAREASQRDNKDFDTLADSLSSDMGASNRVVKGLVRQVAVDNPKIEEAWNHRAQNPKAWQAAQNIIRKELQAELQGQPDRDATEDRQAVAAAVRGSSRKSGPDPDEINEGEVAQMNDAQFEAWVKSQAKKKS